jgi:hypothetical protein
VYDVDEPNRKAFAALDELVVFMPTTTLTCGDSVDVEQMPGGIVEFQELVVALTDGCTMHSNGRLVFRGCSITRDNVNASEFTDYLGPITATVTLEGCVSTNAAEDSGLVSSSFSDSLAEPCIVLNSYVVSGPLENPYESHLVMKNLLIIGSVIEFGSEPTRHRSIHCANTYQGAVWW